jgi:membrane-associated PAP2 superfamily phosphatase
MLSTLRKFRRQAMFIILLLALGPGLLINGILKEHLGRPRPNELVDFGGDYHFVPIGQSGPAGENSSFPSGHASIAFFVMAPWFIYRQRKPFRAYFFLWSGIAFGLAVGFARIMQGGHFLSDVLWAGGLVYITGEILAWVFLV